MKIPVRSNSKIFCFVLVVAFFSGSPADVQEGQPPAYLPDGSNVIAASASLWNQMDNVGTNAVPSTDYTGTTFDAQAADDFTLPAGADGGWEIDQIAVQGSYSSGQATGVRVFIYHDNNGLPGGLYAAQTVNPISGLDTGNFVIDLSPVIYLLTTSQGGATYWLSVQAVMPFTSQTWQWRDRVVQNNNPSAYKIGETGTCSAWQVRTNCSTASTAPDMVFIITGTETINGAGPVIFNTDPGSVIVGSPAISLTVNGRNFNPPGTATDLLWNGSLRPYTSLSDSQIVATIPETDLTPAGTARVSVIVRNTASVASNGQPFTIRQAIYLPVIMR